MNRKRTILLIGIIAAAVLVNIPARWLHVRLDLTDDRRYTLSDPTRQMLTDIDGTIEVVNYLEGDLNSGFRRLRQSVDETIGEMSRYADFRIGKPTEQATRSLSPIVIHERERGGKTAQTTIYPYAEIRYNNRSVTINLLQNRRGLSGEENLNQSIENLEYAFAEAIHSLTLTEKPAVAFLEGHGELPEQNVLDLERELGRYFRVDRGVIGDDPTRLDPYRCIIIADPQIPFSESDRYAIDRYLMRGGRILWAVNGVRFSKDVLTAEGFTPVIAQDLNIQDMLFRYGIRINPVLVQDIQCLPIPVNTAADGQQPNYQPMPWYYAPLLLTSEASPITRNLGQVSSTFTSVVQPVGGEDGIDKQILLATSAASRLIGIPAEVDLSDMNPKMEEFKYQFVPVAMSLEGIFPSAYRHLEAPEGLTCSDHYDQSAPTRQIVIAGGSVLRNEVQRGQTLPLGFDRYSGMQFANRDFAVNALLWLTDETNLIALRQKTIALRLINDKRAHDHKRTIQLISIAAPLALLGLWALLFIFIHHKKYTR